MWLIIAFIPVILVVAICVGLILYSNAIANRVDRIDFTSWCVWCHAMPRDRTDRIVIMNRWNTVLSCERTCGDCLPRAKSYFGADKIKLVCPIFFENKKNDQAWLKKQKDNG